MQYISRLGLNPPLRVASCVSLAYSCSFFRVTAQQTKFEVMHRLQESGITAGAVSDSADIYNDPHTKERGFLDVVDQPEVGVCSIPGRLWKLGETEVPKRSHAPTLVEHNDYALREIIGLTAEEVLELEQEHIIATIPVDV